MNTTKTPEASRPDTLTQKIGVLTRREVEARILAPVIEALGQRFGRDEVVEVVSDAIIKLSQQQGDELAGAMEGRDCAAFESSLQYWTKDDALTLDVKAKDEQTLDFNVVRCKYSEMYRELGIPELGAVFSCNRDYALIEGFNPDAKLTRTQTLMEGKSHCDFRYQFPTDKNTKNET